jgi:hemolysin III
VSTRPQSRGEEIANSAIHGAALLASLVALPLLLLARAGEGDGWRTAGAAIFGATLVLMYSASTAYHLVPRPDAKRILRVIDHGAIYLLIAGTYTPFLVGPLRGALGWSLLATIWGIALFGIVAKMTIGFRFPHLSTALYLGMGWLIVVALKPMAAEISPAGIAWLAAGGLSYTGGVIFYVTDGRLKYGHAIWHVFVAAGSACHFFAVYRYAAG